MAEKSEWQGRVGNSWATEYRRTDRSFTHLTEHLLASTRAFRFERVLDIGCGAGELSLAIARGRPDAMVTGIDISPDLIETAEQRGRDLPNCEFVLADASEWTTSTQPDLLVSRHGVMFFDDAAAAFGHLAAQAESGASLMFSCFRSMKENPVFSEVMRLLPKLPSPEDPHAPGPFAFADPDHVRAILVSGGWSDIAIEPFNFPMIAGAGQDAVEDAVGYFRRIGPAAKAARSMDLPTRDRFFDRIRSMATRFHHDGLVALPAAAWIVTARKATSAQPPH